MAGSGAASVCTVSIMSCRTGISVSLSSFGTGFSEPTATKSCYPKERSCEPRASLPLAIHRQPRRGGSDLPRAVRRELLPDDSEYLACSLVLAFQMEAD